MFFLSPSWSTVGAKGIFILSWYLAWDIELEILSAIHYESSSPPFRNALLTWFITFFCSAFEKVPHSTPRAKLVETMCLMVLLAPVYASSVGIPSSANVIRGSFFLSSFFRSNFSFLMASLSSFLLFFSRVLGERAPVVALSSLFLFFSTALASAAFLASSSLCANKE